MIYIKDTIPVAQSSIIGLQQLFDSYALTNKPRKELMAINGRLFCITSPQELIYGIIKRREIIGFVRLTKSKDIWTVSDVQILNDFRHRGVMTEVFLTILEDLGHIVSNSIQNDGTKALYLSFVKKHPEYELFGLDLDTDKFAPFDYDHQSQYWDGRPNIRLMIKSVKPHQ